jgi:hypothetical protein
MVVSDFDLIGVAVFPYKADSPLVVDPYTVLALSIPRELLKPVTRWGTKVLQGLCPIQDGELSEGHTLNRWR